MSSVRMCDRCRTIFSENDEGWSTFSGSRMIRNDHGTMEAKTMIQDSCGDCTQRLMAPAKKSKRLTLPATYEQYRQDIESTE
jgi:hypothetical protein